MLANNKIIGFVPIKDKAHAKEFYEKTLGLPFVSDDGFAMATPVCMEPIWVRAPDASAYIRNAVPVGKAETPASLTVTALLLNEKMASATGATLPFDGLIRTVPACTFPGGFPVTRRTAARGGST